MEKTEFEKKLEEAVQKEAAEAEANIATEAAELAGGSTETGLETLQKERDELADRLLRMRAEFDNFRKRIHRETERTRELAAEKLLRDLLPVIDHLELALQHTGDQSGGLVEGVTMVVKQFHEVLKRHGLETIPAHGELFNPEVHEAIMQQHSDQHPHHTVLHEFQRGYKLGPVVLRPTKVIVSQHPQDSSASENTEPKSDDIESS